MHPNEQQNSWREELVKILPLQHTTLEVHNILIKFIASTLQTEISKAIRDERKFVLNILDGIDQADKEMGNNGGGTEAIRFALQSRLTSPTRATMGKEE